MRGPQIKLGAAAMKQAREESEREEREALALLPTPVGGPIRFDGSNNSVGGGGGGGGVVYELFLLQSVLMNNRMVMMNNPEILLTNFIRAN